MPKGKVNDDQTVDMQEVRPLSWLLYCVPWSGGGKQEDIIAGWPVNWPLAVEGSSLASSPWDETSVYCSHSGSHFQGRIALREQGVDETAATQR